MDYERIDRINNLKKEYKQGRERFLHEKGQSQVILFINGLIEYIEYLEADKCPYCDSTDQSITGEGQCGIAYHCNQCGANWTGC